MAAGTNDVGCRCRQRCRLRHQSAPRSHHREHHTLEHRWFAVASYANPARTIGVVEYSPMAPLPQPITGRHKDSRKVGNKRHKSQHPRRGHNNFGAITPAAPERKNFGAAFLCDTCREIYAKRSELGRDERMNHGHVVECGAVAPLFRKDAPTERLFSTPVRALLVSMRPTGP